MAITKKSLLGNTSAKSSKSSKSSSAKAPAASKLVSPKGGMVTARMVVGKASLKTGRMYF